LKHDIVIDGVSLLSQLTGIGRYTYEVSKEIVDDDMFEAMFFYGYYSKKLLSGAKKSDKKSIVSIIKSNPVLKSLARKAMQMYANSNQKEFDIYWQPNFIPLDSIKAKKIVTTVHDFSFVHYRDFHPKERIEYIERYFYKNIQKSDIIITVSEYVKNEVIDILKIPSDRVVAIPNGVDHELFRVYDDLSIDIDLPKKFILSVGSIEPRKNLLRLLQAYNSLDREFKDEYKLVLVGFKGWENKDIVELINQNRDNILYLGYLSDIELVKVYNLASIFLYPSLYEGFGLPPLEAMACGTPVITSNVSSIPEVCKDSVVYCDNSSQEDIAKKIVSTLRDDNLLKTLKQKGLERAKEYSWKKSANLHKKLFLDI
jgi:glycosyltransferase involved in cell wall biosynthesis